jgi:hypothetical protein
MAPTHRVSRVRLIASSAFTPEVRLQSGRGNGIADDLRAELERLRAENERLKNRQTRGVSLKVSEKGGVSVYGLGRFCRRGDGLTRDRDGA